MYNFLKITPLLTTSPSFFAIDGATLIFHFFVTYIGVVLVASSVGSILLIVALWKIFAKAGEPGWAAIVPIYNLYVLFKLIFGYGWFFLLLIVPGVNIVVMMILPFLLADTFGKGIGYGCGLLFLAPIFCLILAFGSAEYEGSRIKEYISR